MPMDFTYPQSTKRRPVAASSACALIISAIIIPA
jgi:hypothetical protein